MLIPLKDLKESENRYDSFENVTLRKEISELSKEAFDFAVDKTISPELIQGNIIGDRENLIKRKQMLGIFSNEPADFAYERAIGKNDSVYSNFIELMNSVKRKVGRVVIKDGAKNLSYATGFMVSDTLLLTNWHVFETINDVKNSVIQFNYELDLNGNPKSPITFNLNPDEFFYSFKALDYCFIAVEKNDVSKKNSLAHIGNIYLNPTLGKLGNENEERLNVIHHPNGDYKQLSIRQNRFKKILPTTLWYESDTAQGSSGGPIFNDQWQVVALHHMGVASRNDNGDYLDKEKNIIPIVNDKIDISRIHWIANEGIRISVIMKDIISKFPNSSYITDLQTPSDDFIDNESHDKFTNEKKEPKMNSKQDLVNLSFPPSLISSNGNFNVSFSIKGPNLSENSEIRIDSNLDSILLESKRLEKSMDYSLCRGYQSNFLGQNHPIEIPRPLDEIKRFGAKINGSGGIILKYFKFSVIQHSIRKMPLISAINIDGDSEKRKDLTKRQDKWIRDNRIDFNVQLDNDFYAKSGFDRGHMSRREDANWGGTPEEAKRNADLTCVHTNACPQVPGLNRSNRSGLWGKLENIILEKGAIKEKGEKGKISVFSGPIFKDSDPIFKGVQIPMEYYKIICWLSSSNDLKVTAFKLSQESLVDNIDFEDLDLDQNQQFKSFQCSLKLLIKETNIDFSKLTSFDTFKGNQNTTIDLDSEEDLERLID